MIYGYIRVSTELQNCANQKYELECFAAKNKIQINEYIEETISSRKPLKDRKLGKILEKIGKSDVVITTEISRLGRNMLEVMGILQTCLEKECEIITIKENYHLGADIQSKVLAFAFGLSAEIERTLIAQRTKEALARLKSEGKTLGRPIGSKNKKLLLAGKESTIKKLLNNGFTKSQIAKMLKVDRCTLYYFIKYHLNEKP